MTIYGHDVIDIFINWLPMIVLIGVWMYFLRRMRGGPYSKYQQESMDLTRRQVECLERIAATLEKQA
jgi:ATP-dependent Zn protease